MGNIYSEPEIESVANEVAREFLMAVVEEAEESMPAVPKRSAKTSHARESFCILLKQLVDVKENAKAFELEVRGHEMRDWEVEALATVLQACECVSAVALVECGLGAAAMEALAGVLSENESVARLDISHNAIGALGVRRLLDGLAENEVLRELILAHVQCGDEGVMALADFLAQRPGYLRVVDLAENGITGAGFAAVKELLERNHTMSDIRLKENEGIDNMKTKALGALLKRNEAVQHALDTIVHKAFVQVQLNKRVRETSAMQGVPGISEGRGGDGRRRRGGTIDVSLMRPKLEASQSKKFAVTESKRFKVGWHETVGRRNEMQDTMLVRGCFAGDHVDMFAVFDGHGSKRSSEHAGEHYPAVLERALAAAGDDVPAALTASFLEVNEQMADHVHHGTTALVALVCGSTLYVANVGDSRAVLVGPGCAERLSVDHKADVPEERQRVEAAGGMVRNGRVQGVLQVSRAFGDGAVQPYVIAEPHVARVELGEQHEVLVLACDGVYDVFSDEVVAQIARANPDPQAAARKLVVQAYEAGSTDNISAVVVRLRDGDAADPSSTWSRRRPSTASQPPQPVLRSGASSSDAAASSTSSSSPPSSPPHSASASSTSTSVPASSPASDAARWNAPSAGGRSRSRHQHSLAAPRRPMISASCPSDASPIRGADA